MDVHKKLLAQIERNPTPKKRMPLLLELADLYLQSDPPQTLPVALQALELSKEHNDLVISWQALRLLGSAHYILSDYDAAMKSFNEGLHICVSIGEELGKSRFLQDISKILLSQGQTDQSLQLLDEALDIQRSAGDYKQVVQTLWLKSWHYISMSFYAESMRCCKEALQLVGEHSVQGYECAILDRIGLIYAMDNEYDNALEYLLSGFQLAKATNNLQLYAATAGNIGSVYYKKGEYELAKEYFEQTLAYNQKLGNQAHVAITHGNIAEIYYEKKEYQTALDYITTALNTLGTIDNRYILGGLTSQYGQILNATGRHDIAIAALAPVLETLGDNNDQGVMTNILEQLFAAHQALGNTTQALEYYKLFHESMIDQLNKKQARELSVVKSAMEFEKKEREKEVFRLKAVQLQQELELQNERVVSLGSSLIQTTDFLNLLRQQAGQLNVEAPETRKQIRQLIKQIEQQVEENNTRQNFNESLLQLHGPFHSTLIERYPDLSDQERLIASLIKLNMDSPGIAKILSISIRTVEGHRNKIRKKINISTTQSIKAFLDSMG